MDFVNTILIKDNNSVLMQLRDNKPNIAYPGVWCLPGGGIEPGEEPKDTAIREFLEETEYQLKDPIFLKKIRYETVDGNPNLFLYYELYDGKQRIVCHEGQKMEFLSLDQLNQLESFPNHNIAVLEAVKLVRGQFQG